MSPEEEGMLPPQGGPGQADGAGRRVCLLCPFRDHSSSTSIKGLFLTFFFWGGEAVCHGNFEESCRKPLSGKVNAGDKSLYTI